MHIRSAAAADLGPIAELFTASVHTLATEAYCAEQRAAWAPRPPDLRHWETRLAGLSTLVAHDGAALGGFIAFTADGLIDLLFTAPPIARQGVATQLYRAAEHTLREAGVTTLRADASLVAAPFFARQGFSVMEAQHVERGGVTFKRFAMRKAF